MKRYFTPDMRMSARLSNAEERTLKEPLATPTNSLGAAKVAALPTEKRAVPLRLRSLSSFQRASATKVLCRLLQGLDSRSFRARRDARIDSLRIPLQE